MGVIFAVRQSRGLTDVRRSGAILSEKFLRTRSKIPCGPRVEN